MDKIVKSVLSVFEEDMKLRERPVLSFAKYLEIARKNPSKIFRNHFQFFYDVIKSNLIQINDESSDDPETIGFFEYDSTKLFSTGFDRPFFSDTLLNNKLIQVVEAFNRSSQQNRIYIFEGPPGAGKSTCINNLLRKCEEVANSEEGQRYEALWRIDKQAIKKCLEDSFGGPIKTALNLFLSDKKGEDTHHGNYSIGNVIEVPCPSHDPPILIIPKDYRKKYLEILFKDNPEFYNKLSTYKKYEWIFKDKCCTICESIFDSLLELTGSLDCVLGMIYAKPYEFNRRLGEGITIFNPDDKEPRDCIITNQIIQRELNKLFGSSNKVEIAYSRFAKTNYGFYVLMDIKNQNKMRLEELHNIISEGIHKVGHIEENVNSIFFAVMNPEDKPNGDDKKTAKTVISHKSFQDRQEIIKVSYILDPEQEVKIYEATYGSSISKNFLPKVLLNFAKVIISTRMKKDLTSIREWISEPNKYKSFCDKDLILLRMELYKAVIPKWISEEDKRKLDAKMRHKIIGEAMEKEGEEGCSGRDSLRLFWRFCSPYIHSSSSKLINMSILAKFFSAEHSELPEGTIPDGFVSSLLNMYNYSILQEVKESLFYYNEDQISKDIQNYLFGIFQDIGAEKVCVYTDDRLKITEDFLSEIENRIKGATLTDQKREIFRRDLRKEFSRIIAQELVGADKKTVIHTKVYHDLYDQYSHNLKENVLDPFLKNENFRRAIKDYGKEEFKTYDTLIKRDVARLIEKLQSKFGYSEQGSQEVCIYAIDEKLVEKFHK